MRRLASICALTLLLASLTAGLALGAEPAAPPVSTEPRVSLESVALSDPADAERLERLGFDVTHDVSETAATVAVYSDADRARLDALGFESNTLIEDLAAKSAADRAAEAEVAVPTALPSGRSTYRVYDDYVNEMAQLATDNPDLVRRFTIGQSFEGRPLTGLEIATEVNREDDGRPTFVQAGIHHAREWPSGEFPMEFAIDLVQRFRAGDARVASLLGDVRVVILPVVNPDGFIASRGSAPHPGGTPVLVGGVSEFRRKNCRPATPADAAVPCPARPLSGVDLNRNYGYYWGGPGSSTDVTSDRYRGTGPFSEPESEAFHQFSQGVQPTVVISNHTFTDTGWWLRQPGFNAPFFDQEAPGYSPGCDANLTNFDCSVVPDEPAMKTLGDSMSGATGWPSDLGWELGDITGATEDWNYFAQGSYGYTPEARGPDFHDFYSSMVVDEYEGVGPQAGRGVREAYLLAGEEAADRDNHGVIQGTAPPGATLTLRKEFDAPRHPNNGGAPVDEVLQTTLRGPADGTYEWDVMPSDRPQIPGGPLPPGDEQWTMTCQRPGQGTFGPVQVEVDRGQVVTQDWGAACGVDPPGNQAPEASFTITPDSPEVGEEVSFISTSTDSDGTIDPSETKWDLDNDNDFDDATGLTATRTFNTEGFHTVRLQVTDNEGASDIEVRTVTVSAPANQEPTASFDFSPAQPFVGEDVSFTSSSTDSDGSILTHEWDLDGDGDYDDGLGSQVTRIYTQAGTFEIGLRVTDDDGASDTTTRTLVVRPRPQNQQPQAAPAPEQIRCGGLIATRVGTAGDDLLIGTAGDDVIAALAGDDRVRALAGNDRVCGARGGDAISGGAGNDSISGNKDDDRLRGNAGDDVLAGGLGDDALSGGPGADDCEGGGGDDRLRNCP